MRDALAKVLRHDQVARPQFRNTHLAVRLLYWQSRDAMIAAHSQRLYIPSRTTGARHLELRDLVQHAVTRMRQVVCGLSGHSMLLHFEGDRMSLRCFGCGMQTPGWTIDVRPEFRRTRRPPLRLVRRAA